MTTEAYRQNYKLIEWAPIKPSEPKRETPKGKAAYFVPDIQPFVSPMSRRVISSRKHLRDEERAYNVKQVGNDLKPHEYDNSHRLNEGFNERHFDRAFKAALEKTGL